MKWRVSGRTTTAPNAELLLASNLPESLHLAHIYLPKRAPAAAIPGRLYLVPGTMCMNKRNSSYIAIVQGGWVYGIRCMSASSMACLALCSSQGTYAPAYSYRWFSLLIDGSYKFRGHKLIIPPSTNHETGGKSGT